MIAVRRLLAVTAFLAVIALITSSDVWGDPRDKEKKGEKNTPASKLKGQAQFSEELEKNRFAEKPLLSYQEKDETYFALQVQPKLPEVAARPIDYLVIVETSA